MKNDAWTCAMTHYMVMCKPLCACQSSFQIQDSCQQLPPQLVKDTGMREEKIKEEKKTDRGGGERDSFNDFGKGIAFDILGKVSNLVHGVNLETDSSDYILQI